MTNKKARVSACVSVCACASLRVGAQVYSFLTVAKEGSLKEKVRVRVGAIERERGSVCVCK